MTEKGLKVNMKKTKAFCTSEKTVSMETFKFPCSVCGGGMGSSPFYVSNVTFRCIKNASQYKNALACYRFLCRKCSGFTCSAEADVDVSLDGDKIEKVTKFS